MDSFFINKGEKSPKLTNRNFVYLYHTKFEINSQ